MDLGISDKRVLVTGASQGIGEAIAKLFAKEGCRVSVVARREEVLQKICDEMGGAKKGHSYIAADLMEEGEPQRAVRDLTKEGEPFDIAVHNVGGTLAVKNPLAPAKEWERVWRYNAGIAIDMNEILVPPMSEKKWGRIIHISSISGESFRGSGPYACAKAFLNGYVKCLGRAVAPSGVVVSGILPGAVFAEGGHWDNIAKTNPDMMKDFLRHHHAVGRLGTADEIAPFVLFMASQYVTFAQASLIPVDGGTM